jgi:bifunctional enzyme CysN/CysC
MSHQSDLIATDIDAYLDQHERKEILRFLTCGSVDDGKSTLIGRLLHDSKMIYEDQLAAIHSDSKRQGSAGEEVDLALLMDGLKAEREQGITIDVAYRYFSTARRKFIIADTPGHVQYTRNMVTGASTADLAIILVDAKNGILPQTKRHSFIASLLGIRHVVVAINKMDLVDYSQERYEEIRRQYIDFVAKLDIADLHFIPMSALKGDNVVDPGEKMKWFHGAPLMEHLETVQIASDRNLIDMRFPVQWVNRPDHTFRGFCGTLASGIVRVGDEVAVLPSRKTTRVSRIIAGFEDVKEAFAPMSVTLVLSDEVDVSRGDMLVNVGNVPKVRREFEAMVVWMADAPMVPGKDYMLMQSTKQTVGTITDLRYRVDVNTLSRQESTTLGLNEIGRCRVKLNQPFSFDAYKGNRGTGSFIIVDRMTNGTVGAGMILARESADASDHWSRPVMNAAAARKAVSKIGAEERASHYGHPASTLLLTGLSCSGKTTIAVALERRLFDLGHAVGVLDGQNMRTGLSREIGYTAPERSENMRRGGEVARLYNDSGIIAICSFTAPDKHVRERAKHAIAPHAFMEVHVDAPIEVCRARDKVGTFDRAETGEIAQFPGVTAPYDAPEDPAVHLDTVANDVDACVDLIVAEMRKRGLLRPS